MPDTKETVLGIPSDQLEKISLKANIGFYSFEKAVRQRYMIIDKSIFIKRFLEVRQSCLVFLRPRRFGKSLNLSMLKYFLDQQVNDQATKFQNFAIMKEHEIVEMHMGKYPVVFLSLKDCKANTWDEMRTDIWFALVHMCDPHIKSGKVQWADLINPNCLGISPTVPPTSASDTEMAYLFQFLIRQLRMVYDKKVIVIVDEYDCPMNVAMRQEEDMERRNKFFEKFYSSALKDNNAVKKACLAGIYHIRGANILSAISNSRVNTIRDSSNFGDCFGFTEREVKCFLKDAFNASEENVNNLWEKEGGIKEWYNGYCIGGNMLFMSNRSLSGATRGHTLCCRFGSSPIISLRLWTQSSAMLSFSGQDPSTKSLSRA